MNDFSVVGVLLRTAGFALCLVCACGSVGHAQMVSEENNCESNEALSSVYSGLRKEGTKIIVIARQGSKEKSAKYALRNLEAFKHQYHRGFNDNQLVFALGARSKGNPQVEVYINGKLELIFEVPHKQTITVGNCGN